MSLDLLIQAKSKPSVNLIFIGSTIPLFVFIYSFSSCWCLGHMFLFMYSFLFCSETHVCVRCIV